MIFQDQVLASKPKPYVIAHRGNQRVCPENTLAAFRQALKDGADILETDLQLTSDEVFVCIHDSSVDRTTNGHGLVSELTSNEIRSLSASGGDPEFDGEKIPFLSDLASILPEDVLIALELKSDQFRDIGVCRKLVSELDSLGILNRSMILSFSATKIKNIRKITSDLPTGWITLFSPFPWINATLLGPFWPLMILNPLYVWLAHRQKKWVCPLDPNPDSRIWLYKLLKCDAVLSDDPASTCRALGR